MFVCMCVRGPTSNLQQLKDFHVTNYELNPIAIQLMQEVDVFLAVHHELTIY